MKVGFVGLGKLGLPCATSVAMRGHDVKGYDLDPSRMSKQPQPYQEAGPDGTEDFNDFLADSPSLSFGTLQEVVDHSDILFLAVQTPHNALYEGTTRIPPTRVDFDYTFLSAAARNISQALENRTRPIVLTIISTCLPGSVRKHILPIFQHHPLVSVVYNPFFIAMGTTMRDFVDPEFVLMGADNHIPRNAEALEKVAAFYSTIHDAPITRMSIESAELTKVAYNTYISFKIAYANTLMEICDHFPMADCDEVVDALSLAHRRIIAPTYMRGGMGDGGGCHPRDNIAMSWLAEQLDLSFDLFDAEMICRERQAEKLADDLMEFADGHEMDSIVILGYAFKPESNLTVGSPALLVRNLLEEKGCSPIMMDSFVTGEKDELIPAVYLIGCRHKSYRGYRFPKGSVVLDPFRMIPEQEGVVVHNYGKRIDRSIT